MTAYGTGFLVFLMELVYLLLSYGTLFFPTFLSHWEFFGLYLLTCHIFYSIMVPTIFRSSLGIFGVPVMNNLTIILMYKGIFVYSTVFWTFNNRWNY